MGSTPHKECPTWERAVLNLWRFLRRSAAIGAGQQLGNNLRNVSSFTPIITCPFSLPQYITVACASTTEAHHSNSSRWPADLSAPQNTVCTVHPRTLGQQMLTCLLNRSCLRTVDEKGRQLTTEFNQAFLLTSICRSNATITSESRRMPGTQT